MLSLRRSFSLLLLPILAAGACDSDDEPAEDGPDTEEPSCVPSRAAPRRDATPLEPQEIQAIRDAVAANLGTGAATGYSVAVWRDGEVIYAEGFGAKDPEGAPVTPATLFQIGSDTKKITAVGLLRQVEAGRADLDDTVADIEPSLVLAASPDALANLSIHDLLAQRSGLYDYTAWFEASDDDQLGTLVRGRFAENEYSLMPPGIAFNYSNPNYYLAGFLTEVLDGRPWPDVVTEDVFAPLGLRHTYARRDDMLAAEDDIASAYGLTADFDTFSLIELLSLLGSPDIGWRAPEEQRDNALVRPAGLVWSTATDQARLLGFFIDGNDCVLSDELREEMMTAQTEVSFLNDYVVSAYGYGLFADSSYVASDGRNVPVPFVFHGGNTLTMTSDSLTLPDQRVAVSALANGTSEAALFQVAQVALEVAAGSRLPAATPAEPDFEAPSADLQAYAGTYHDENLGEVIITWETDHLIMAIPVLASLGVEIGPALEPVALDQFAVSVDGSPERIIFHDGEDGTPHRYGMNRSFVLNRQ